MHHVFFMFEEYDFLVLRHAFQGSVVPGDRDVEK